MNRIIALSLLLSLVAMPSIGAGEDAEAKGPSAEEVGRKIDQTWAELKEKLKLTPEQRERLKAVVDEKSENIKEFTEDTRRRIRDILTPEQRARFDRKDTPRH